jgi:hypothetical protein
MLAQDARQLMGMLTRSVLKEVASPAHATGAGSNVQHWRLPIGRGEKFQCERVSVVALGRDRDSSRSRRRSASFRIRSAMPSYFRGSVRAACSSRHISWIKARYREPSSVEGLDVIGESIALTCARRYPGLAYAEPVSKAQSKSRRNQRATVLPGAVVQCRLITSSQGLPGTPSQPTMTSVYASDGLALKTWLALRIWLGTTLQRRSFVQRSNSSRGNLVAMFGGCLKD